MASFGNRNAFRDVDRVYRRGLVLGLTVAEVFLLLLFLLLLALVGTALEWIEQVDRAETLTQENTELVKNLDEARRELAAQSALQKQLAAAGFDKDKIETLIATNKEIAKLDRQLDDYRTRIAELEPLAEKGKKLSDIEEKTGLSADEIADLHQQLDDLQPLVEAGKALRAIQAETGLSVRAIAAMKDQLDELRPLAEAGKILKDIQDETGLSPDEIAPLAELGEQLKETEKRTGRTLAELERQSSNSKPEAELRADNAALETRYEELKKEVARLDALASSKGIDPSCWYEESEDVGENTRERPIPLFDVAVFDDYILVRDRDVPEKYQAEKRNLPTGAVKFMQPLSDKQFMDDMRPIRRLAKEGKGVRPYSCVFYVNIWDETSPNAKARYKRATETVIGSAFYRTNVFGASW